MATNKPTGDNARKGAVKKRTQLKTKTQGKDSWTKRSKESGQFLEREEEQEEIQRRSPREESSMKKTGRLLSRPLFASEQIILPRFFNFRLDSRPAPESE